jgi:hypothetical protein
VESLLQLSELLLCSLTPFGLSLEAAAASIVGCWDGIAAKNSRTMEPSDKVFVALLVDKSKVE